MTLRKEKYFKVTEYHLPMVLFKYWFTYRAKEEKNYFTQNLFDLDF